MRRGARLWYLAAIAGIAILLAASMAASNMEGEVTAES